MDIILLRKQFYDQPRLQCSCLKLYPKCTAITPALSFFVDATSQNYLGSSDNWFSIELDFSSLNNEYVSGISYDEAKSIVQAINIENGSQPHLLNGLPYLTDQSN